ncbi:extracellular matrix protein [Phialemonium atrogriseum]|uniref:Extracellular matrix protein n=1 Tax=Phialemonium atrogriseum TaxID=1093897 RepID=A0AAJ0C2L4_9PEZI|nr:extracellular matrix protein [Phialemonium atrogriseum]KAK1768347.1 extracellular matrix protein [Phialemonium atrogriseum]
MKVFALAAVAALAAIAQAKVAFTNSAYNIQAGEPFTLTWAGNTGPVTITLKNGPERDLKTVQVLDSNDLGNSFTWTPPRSLATDTYAFEIKDSSSPDEPNYSPPFDFEGTEAPSSSGSLTATGVSSTSSGTASASTPISSTVSGNRTTSSSNSSGTPSTSRTSTRTSATTTTSAPTLVPTNTNDGQRSKSPLALVLVTIAALLYFN